MAEGLKEETVYQRLKSLSASQESIESLAMWALHHKANHGLITSVWASVFRTGKTAELLTGGGEAKFSPNSQNSPKGKIGTYDGPGGPSLPPYTGLAESIVSQLQVRDFRL